MKFNFSLDIAVVTSLLSVFFYACGQNYLAAYMAVFLIDPVVLNFSAAEKINWGFLNCGNGLIILLLTLQILFIFLYVIAICRINFSKKLFSFFKSNKKNLPLIHNQNIIDDFHSNRIRHYFWLSSLCLLLLITFLSFAAIDIRTTNDAKKALANPHILPLVKTSNPSDNKTYLIKCGSSLCATIDEEKNISLVEPKNVVILGSNFKHNKAP